MSVVVRLFVVASLVASSILTGCGGTPTALPTPTVADTPVATPEPPDIPVPSDTSPRPATGDPDGAPGPIASPVDAIPPGDPEPAPDGAPPALSTLTVSPAGLGPLLVGTAVPDVGQPSAMVTWDSDYCAEFPHPQGGSTGAYIANYPKAVSPSLGSRAPFSVVTTDGNPAGTITSVLVFSPDVSTAEGVRVGSTRAELVAAYPAFAEERNAQLSDIYVLNGATGRLVIEVAKVPAAPLADYWPEEAVETVLWMMVLPADHTAYAIAGSDAGGPCAI